jgi:hypothetical protein
MVDQPTAEAESTAAHCPWCSAELPAEASERCPSCGATLVGEAEAALPGVTAIDPEAIVRNARTATTPRRSRLLSWFGGEDTSPDEAPPTPGSLAPPPPDVRREILRLELEAEVANLQAEADSIVAEAAVDAEDEGVSIVPPDRLETDGEPTSEASPEETGDAGEGIEPPADSSQSTEGTGAPT